MKAINEELLDLGRAKYRSVVGLDDMPRDKEGFIVLKPTAARVDQKMTTLTADIGSLEAKLKKYKAEREKTEKYTKTEDYKESKKQMSKKKQKKKRESLLLSVFNNADALKDEDEEEEFDEEEGSGYIEKKKKGSSKKSNASTLETTYGKRFSPVVSMLYDTITEFDQIAAEIEQDLKDNKNSSRTMYRSSQIGNMISAKNSKLSAVKELASVATTLSNLEYKQAKDKKDAEGADANKAVASMAAKVLRGGLDDIDVSSKKKKKKGDDKKSKKTVGKLSFGATKGISRDDDDDSEEIYGSIKRSKSDDEEDQRALASEFAKTLSNRKGEMKFTPWEKNIAIEGTYHIMVVVDPMNLDDYRFAAISNKTGKEIKDFKNDYPDLLPKKKKVRLRFDLNKGRCTDLNSSRTYKLLYKD